MKIVFYYLVPNKGLNSVIYNEGIAVLSALAKEKGCSVVLQRLDLADFQAGFDIQKDADIFGISFASLQYSLARKLFDKISTCNERKGLVLVGGIHATVDRDSVIDIDTVDMVISGEGEEPFKWVIDNLNALENNFEHANISNTYLKGFPAKPLCKTSFIDPNTLPFPDRSIFDNNLLRKAPEFIFSRGCPFSCAYCANEFLNSKFGAKIRRKNPEYCMGELENTFCLLDISKDTLLTFHDDVFLLDNVWLDSFSKNYKTTYKNPFRCNTTASAVTDDKIKLLKEMNCAEVWVGIETGNEEYRKNVLKKNISNKQIINAFNLINKHGLKGVSFNLLGCPGETSELLEETLELNRKCNVYSASTAMFVPFPGTTLFDEELKKGNVRKLTEEEKDFGVSTSGLIRKNISDDDYYYWQKMFKFRIENKILKYYLVLILKTFPFSARFLSKLMLVVRHFTGVPARGDKR